ncbi:MAG: hypothetical protein QOI10_1553 [Solirubrobacterales bacterium]|nr:hypothetical protein [Solirubrobacterales bacterium]
MSRRFLTLIRQLAVLATASVLTVGLSTSVEASLNPQSVPSPVVSFGASALTPDGRIVVAGSMYDPEKLRPIVARYLPDGTLDPSFGHGGYTALDRTESPNPPNAVAVAPNGDILLAGPGARLVRLTGRGELDRSFGVEGVAVPQPAGGSIDHLAVDSAGRPLVAGSIGNTLAVERFTVDGRPDESFDGDGLTVASPIPASSLQGLYSFQRGAVVAVRPDDRILVIGQALQDSGDAEVVAAQFNVDGTPDASFNGDGSSEIPVADSSGSTGSSPYYAVKALAMDQAGAATVRLAPETAFPDAPSFCRGGSALRIRADGTLDSAFGIASREPAGVCPADLVVLSSGGVFAVGHEYVKEGTDTVTQTAYTPEGQFDPASGSQTHKLLVAGLYSWGNSVQLLPSGIVATVGTAYSDDCYVSPPGIGCEFGFVLAQRPDGEVVGDFGTRGIATLPETRICSDPFEYCPYPDPEEFRRLVRRQVDEIAYRSRDALRTRLGCPVEARETCEVRAWFTAPRSDRVLTRIRSTSIHAGRFVPRRSEALKERDFETVAQRKRLEIHVAYSAPHQPPTRFQVRLAVADS